MGAGSALRVPGAIAVTAALLAVAACGGGTSQTAPASGTQTQVGADSAPVRIRIVLAPDPVWEGMKDAGIVQRWEASGNVRVEASSSFDQFAAFAGGHVDAALMNALDVPEFVQQSQRQPVIVAKIATDRSFLGVSRTSQASGLNDLVETRIAVDGSLESTLLWGVIADSLYGLDFRLDSPDFELIVVDSASVADLVVRGDAEACICTPDFAVSLLAERTLKPLYDGRTAVEVYAEEVVGDPAVRPIADALVVDKQWHDNNPGAVAALQGMWDEGLKAWKADTARHVRGYPHLLSVQTDDEVAWMVDYLTGHDWVYPSTYLTAEDRAQYSDLFVRMQDIGLVANSAREPEMSIREPGTGVEE